ncbi:MAG TPA: hypothetical protein VF781_12015 [Solirubrobacteraceae bacterium]
MSFFDEADEPRTETHGPPRNPSRPRRPSGTGRQPPRDQSVQTRRAVLAVALLIVVILIALGVHSCQVSANESALKDYTNHVSSLITQSNATGKQLFGQLAPSGGQQNGPAVQTQINGTLNQAQNELRSARDYSAPDAVKTANQNFVLALKMRADGIRNVAGQIQPALGNQTSQTAVNSIAAEMARFYASDVLYKDYAAPEIAAALHAAGIAVGGNGETIAGGQFVPNLLWLTPSYISGQLHVASSGGTGPASSHSHKLTQVAIGSNTMVPGVTNHTPATPPAVFTLTFTNASGSSGGGNLTCNVTVAGTGITGTATATAPSAGQTGTCQVTLSASPPVGVHPVTASVQSSPSEGTNKTNSESFPLDFQ